MKKLLFFTVLLILFIFSNLSAQAIPTIPVQYDKDAPAFINFDEPPVDTNVDLDNNCQVSEGCNRWCDKYIIARNLIKKLLEEKRDASHLSQ
jgi:hypothetical protein